MDDARTTSVTAPSPGDPAAVSSRGGGPMCEGTFVVQRGFAVSVALAVVPFADGDDVLIACGPVGSRVAALARFVSASDGAVHFARQSAWRPVDTRHDPRYRTRMRASIRRTEGNLHATVLDVSRGGVALAVPESPGRARFDVRIGAAHTAPFLPCRLTSVSERAGGTVLHVSFEHLDQRGAAYVENLVTELCTALEPGLLVG